MKDTFLLFRYLPLLYLAGALIINLDEGFGFARAIDVSLGTMFSSTTGVSLVIACILAWAYYFYDRKKQTSLEQPVQQQAATPQATNTEPDTKFYEQALAELDSDERNSGIWAKAYAGGADEEHSRKLYVKLRASSLMNEQARSLIDEAAAEEEKLGVVAESQKLKRQKEEVGDIFIWGMVILIAMMIAVPLIFL